MVILQSFASKSADLPHREVQVERELSSSFINIKVVVFK